MTLAGDKTEDSNRIDFENGYLVVAVTHGKRVVRTRLDRAQHGNTLNLYANFSIYVCQSEVDLREAIGTRYGTCSINTDDHPAD